jgi:hypothetical protein
MLASLCWLVEREREKGERENPFTPSPLHEGFLCWLVERERRKGRRKVALW